MNKKKAEEQGAELPEVSEESMDVPTMTRHDNDGEGYPIFKPTAKGQVNLDGEEARYPIEHEVTTTITHKFSSAIAKLSLSEKAYSKEMEKDRPDLVGLVKTRLKPARSVEPEQWGALCAEFAAKVEEEM